VASSAPQRDPSAVGNDDSAEQGALRPKKARKGGSMQTVEYRILATLGKVAGLAGVALGVFLLIFKDALQAGLRLPLGQERAFHFLLAALLLTFGIALVGILAWLTSLGKQAKDVVPSQTLVILACAGLIVVAAVVYLVGRSAGGKDLTQQFLRVARWDGPLDGDVKKARSELHGVLNAAKDNLDELGFQAAGISRLEFLARMAMAFHDDLDTKDHEALARSYATAARDAKQESDSDRLWGGVASAIEASTTLFDREPDYREAGRAIERADQLLEASPEAVRKRIWMKYRTLVTDYRIEYLFARPDANPSEGARLCIAGLEGALRSEDSFALKRLVYRGLKWSHTTIRGSLFAEVPPDAAALRLLYESLTAFDRYVVLSKEARQNLSERTVFAYLPALELATWPQLKLQRWNGDRGRALEELDRAIESYQHLAADWGRTSIDENAVLLKTATVNWYCRLLVLSYLSGGKAEKRESWWATVENVLGSLSGERVAAQILVGPGALRELKNLDGAPARSGAGVRVPEAVALSRGAATYLERFAKIAVRSQY
jgi:hypothetical protein